MKQYLMEGIGTFLLVLLVVLISNNAPAASAPIAYGAAVTALLYAGREVSGAHFNPAVSLAMLIRGGLERWDFPYYLAAQVAGGTLGAVLAIFLIRCGGTSETALRTYDPLCAFFAEATGTFAVALVFLSAAQTKSGEDSPHLGIATGFAVMAAAFALRVVSPAAFNPALLLGMAIAGKILWGDIWPGLLGTAVGAAVAASVFRSLRDTDTRY